MMEFIPEVQIIDNEPNKSMRAITREKGMGEKWTGASLCIKKVAFINVEKL